MRTSRIHVNQPLGPGRTISLPADATHYVRHVLRLKAGATIALFNGSDDCDYPATLVYEGKKILVEIVSSRQVQTDSLLETEIIQGVSRSDRIDFSIQKCTELGISRFSIFNAHRTQHRLNPNQQEKRLLHWQTIAINACEQCGRHRLPDVRFYSELDAALRQSHEKSKKIILDFDGPALATQIQNRDAGIGFSLLVGPEGGLSSDEKTLAGKNDYMPARLGPRVLRTETAAMAALSVIQSICGDMAG